MGCCDSEEAHEKDNREHEAQVRVSMNPIGPGGRLSSKPVVVPTDDSLDAEDFRKLLQHVTIAILKKLATALEYEKIAFQELAKRRRLNDYMELMAPNVYQQLFREVLDIEEGKNKDVFGFGADGDEKHRHVLEFLAFAEKAEYRHQYTISYIAEKYQTAAKLCATELEKGYKSSDISALKIQLQTFGTLLGFCYDVTEQNADQIYQNINDVIEKLSDTW